MILTILGSGTSQGVPVIGCNCEVCLSKDIKDKRLRTSAHIKVEGVNLQIDVGPDFRQQMLATKIPKIDAVLLTHEHTDHMIGLDDLRPYIFKSGRAMRLYGLKRVLERVKSRFDYAFTEKKYPGAPRFELHEINYDRPFLIKNIEVIPIKVNHGSLDILGYRIHDCAYLTDVKKIDSQEMTKLHDLSCLVISALREKVHHSHASLNETLEIIDKIKPKRTFITHISHEMGRNAHWENRLPPHVKFAYDFMRTIC